MILLECFHDCRDGSPTVQNHRSPQNTLFRYICVCNASEAFNTPLHKLLFHSIGYLLRFRKKYFRICSIGRDIRAQERFHRLLKVLTYHSLLRQSLGTSMRVYVLIELLPFQSYFGFFKIPTCISSKPLKIVNKGYPYNVISQFLYSSATS